MLLKRLTDSLPSHAAALIPLLDPEIQTTEQLTLTPRVKLLGLLTAAVGEETSVSGARRIAALGAALDGLVAALSPARKSGVDIARASGRPWEGLGVLEDVLPWEGRGVLSLAGGKGVGKSLLALHAVLRLLMADTRATARWVDTEGAFSAARAQAVLHFLGGNESALERLTVSRAFRLEPELFDILAELRDEPTTRVLVIDNIAALFRDALMGYTAQGHAAMVVAMEEVATLTYERGMTTIVVNSATSSVPTNRLSRFSATTVKPSLGPTFAFASDIELLLQDTGRVFGLADQGERERAASAPGLRILVEVLKSRPTPTGRWGVVETDGIAVYDTVPPPEEDERTLYRSAGGATGRPALGYLGETLEPAIAPLTSRRT